MMNFSYKLPIMVLMIYAIIECTIGLAQFYGIIETQTIFKIVGTFQNPDYFAYFLAFVAPVSLVIYLSFDDKYLKLLSTITIVLIFVTIPATASRGAIVSIIISCLYITYIYKKRHI